MFFGWCKDHLRLFDDLASRDVYPTIVLNIELDLSGGRAANQAPNQFSSVLHDITPPGPEPDLLCPQFAPNLELIPFTLYILTLRAAP